MSIDKEIADSPIRLTFRLRESVESIEVGVRMLFREGSLCLVGEENCRPRTDLALGEEPDADDGLEAGIWRDGVGVGVVGARSKGFDDVGLLGGRSKTDGEAAAAAGPTVAEGVGGGVLKASPPEDEG
jgi:hypothetical protein